MSNRFLIVALALTVVTSTSVAVAIGQQPRITNGKVASQTAGSPFAQSFRTLVAAQNYTPGGVKVFDARTLELVADIPAEYTPGKRSRVVGLVDVPGKRNVERAIVKRPSVLRVVNSLRAHAGQPPLEF